MPDADHTASPPSEQSWYDRVAAQTRALNVQAYEDHERPYYEEAAQDGEHPGAAGFWAWHDHRAALAGELPTLALRADADALTDELAAARSADPRDLRSRDDQAADYAARQRPWPLDTYEPPTVEELFVSRDQLVSLRNARELLRTQLAARQRGLGRIVRRRVVQQLCTDLAEVEQQTATTVEQVRDLQARLTAIRQRRADLADWDHENRDILTEGGAARLELTVRQRRAERAGVPKEQFEAELRRRDQVDDLELNHGNARVTGSLHQENGLRGFGENEIVERAELAQQRARNRHPAALDARPAAELELDR